MIEGADGSLRLSGPLTIASATRVLEEMREVWPAAGFAGPLVIDIGSAGPMDSAAISLMLSWRRKAHREGIALRFTGMPPELLALADLYGVGELLQADTPSAT